MVEIDTAGSRQPLRVESPVVRVRLHHGRTIKEVWGYDDTVEITMPLGTTARETQDAAEAMRHELMYFKGLAREIGEGERDLRNQRDPVAG